MGAARSALTRTVRGPLQAQRQIDKALDGQPTLAPKHQTTKDLLDKAKQGAEYCIYGWIFIGSIKPIKFIKLHCTRMHPTLLFLLL
jgi:hypothetical protein